MLVELARSRGGGERGWGVGWGAGCLGVGGGWGGRGRVGTGAGMGVRAGGRGGSKKDAPNVRKTSICGPIFEGGSGGVKVPGWIGQS